MIKGQGGYGSLHYGHAYGVNAASDHEYECWKLLEWLALAEIDGITPIGHQMQSIGSLPINLEDIHSHQYYSDKAIYQGFVENLMIARNSGEVVICGAELEFGQIIDQIVKGTAPSVAIANRMTDILKKQDDYQKGDSSYVK